MVKRHDQINVFNIATERRSYIVALERLNNGINGNPRYKAVIIFPEEDTKSMYNAVYTFSGHYYGEYGEAEYIVKIYEEQNKQSA
jgi:hypothetical protein